MKTNRLLALSAIVIGWWLTGCGKHAPPPTPPPAVSVIQPVAREVVFLQNWRASIIPMLAVPVSLIDSK